MTYIRLEDLAQLEPFPGCKVRPVHTENMTLTYWDIDAGANVPEHLHPHEQVVNVIEGQFELTIEGETRVLSSGLVASIPSNAVHSGRAVTDCRIIDAFHPVREDLR